MGVGKVNAASKAAQRAAHAAEKGPARSSITEPPITEPLPAPAPEAAPVGPPTNQVRMAEAAIAKLRKGSDRVRLANEALGGSCDF